MSDNEIYKTILKSSADTCGRFLPTQLNSPIHYGGENKLRWHRYFFSFFIPAFLLTKQSNAQRLTGKIAMPVCNTTTKGELAVLPASRQFEITGVIIDSATKKAIQNVSIQYGKMQQGTMTDSMGGFAIRNKTNAAKITLQISALGYETKSIEISIPQNGIAIHNEIIYLKPFVKQLDNVIIQSYETVRLMGLIGGMSISVRRRALKELPKRIITMLNDSLKIYPNPVKRESEFNVALKLKQTGDYVLQIIDVSGKLMYQEPFNTISKQYNKKLRCDERWSGGVYFIRVLSNQNKLISTSRFVVE